MIAKSPVAITDAIDSRTVGGGGVFVHFDKISEKSAQVYVETEIQNDNTRSESVTIETTLTDAEGNVIKRFVRVMPDTTTSRTVGWTELCKSFQQSEG